MRKGSTNPQEVAEIVAIQALSFLASDPERLGTFLTESGIGPQTLRASATDPKFLAGVLDFIMRDDATVQARCRCLPADAGGHCQRTRGAGPALSVPAPNNRTHLRRARTVIRSRKDTSKIKMLVGFCLAIADKRLAARQVGNCETPH